MIQYEDKKNFPGKSSGFFFKKNIYFPWKTEDFHEEEKQKSV